MKKLRAIVPITTVIVLFLLTCWSWSREFDIRDAYFSIGDPPAHMLLNLLWCFPLLIVSFLICLRALSREEPLGELATPFVVLACVFTLTVVVSRGSYYAGALHAIRQTGYVRELTLSEVERLATGKTSPINAPCLLLIQDERDFEQAKEYAADHHTEVLFFDAGREWSHDPGRVPALLEELEITELPALLRVSHGEVLPI